MDEYLKRKKRCVHCKTAFIIMTSRTGSYLPIEIIDGHIPEEEEYDPLIHKSHLLSCEPRRKDWNIVQKKLIDSENKKLGLDQKGLLK